MVVVAGCDAVVVVFLFELREQVRGDDGEGVRFDTENGLGVAQGG